MLVLNCNPQIAYATWMNSKKHSEMIGEKNAAKIDPKVGGKFSIWDGAIKRVLLGTDGKILQIS